jgi:HEAT repeat protein
MMSPTKTIALLAILLAGAAIASAAPAAVEGAADARDRFLVIERIARLPAAEQAKELPRFYRELAPRYMNPVIEGILSSTPTNILDPNPANGFDGNTAIWAKQLAEAASELSPEEVADKLKVGLYLNVAARARALQVLKAHAKATEALIQEDLKSGQKASVSRAASTIDSLQWRTFTDQLLAIYLADDEEMARNVGSALGRDQATLRPLLARVEKEPKFLVRCAGLLQGILWRKPAEPLLLKLLDSPDAEVRYHAGHAVYECRDPKLAAPTVKFAQEKEPRFRIVAAYLASNLPADEFTAVRKDLVSLLNDPDEAVRFEALRCFAQQKDLAACPVILELLMRNHPGPAGQREITVMQSLAALTGQQFGYDMHNWGPGTPGNQQAIRQFQDWMKTRGVPVPHIFEPGASQGMPRSARQP